MTKRRIVAGVAAFALAATGFASSAHAAAKIQVGVILPDAASSARWETADRGFLKTAFTKAKVR